MKKILDTKRVLITYTSRPRPDGRKYAYRHRSGHYVQIRGLEVVVWL